MALGLDIKYSGSANSFENRPNDEGKSAAPAASRPMVQFKAQHKCPLCHPLFWTIQLHVHPFSSTDNAELTKLSLLCPPLSHQGLALPRRTECRWHRTVRRAWSTEVT